jgi:molybdopterin-guanine dinucleotide biosynthesis protein A
MASSRVLGAILAGGNSARFGSDKALAQLDGTALFDLVRAGLAPQVDAVVCCGRDWPGLAALTDRPEPGLGPLAGLCAALHHAETKGFERVLAVPVDVLPVPESLIEVLGRTGPTVLASQFLVGLWPAALAAQLEEHLRAGKRAVRSWIEVSGARYIDDSRLGLVNINRTADFERLPGPDR